MGLNWAIMKQRMLGLALWPLFFSLQLLQQVCSNACSNNSYVINVMLMNCSDFPSSTDNLKLAVKQALKRVQNEFPTTGKATGVGYPSPAVVSCQTLCHSFLLIWPSANCSSGSLPVRWPYVDLTEIITSLCKNISALQMGRTIFAFMVFGQTLPAWGCSLGVGNMGIAELDQTRPVIHLVQ